MPVESPSQRDDVPLPAPSVAEALDGFIDSEYLKPLTVRVGAYAGMAANDIVTIHWETRGKRHDEPVRITAAWVGAALSISIPNRCLSSSNNRVSYSVQRFAGGTAASETLILNERT